MTREEFDEIMFRTLVAMGDPAYVGNDPSWDAEYEKMKLLSSDAFSNLCKVSANRYKRGPSRMSPKKIIYTHIAEAQLPCTAVFIRIEPENLEWASKMHSRICIPLKNLIPTHRYGAWMSMGTVGWN